jgi:hypothetical protein
MAGTGVGKFSSTASNNTSNLTVNFAENMAPSNVNNAARELMGHMRDMYEQLGDGYFEFGDGDGTYTVARGDADTITITSASDISGIYFAGRKIRITDGGANVVEGTIASSSHSSTTQTVNLTGISLASGTPTKVELGIDTAAFGGRVILDDDGDTYIEAPTDDTIDIYVAGAKDFVITANTFTAESGSTITGPTVVGSTSIKTPLIEFTDGDDAITIADGGGVTFPIASTFTLGFTSNAASTITTADNTDTLSLISTDADGSLGPNLRFYRNSSSPADADDLSTVDFEGRNDNSQDVVYAQILTATEDVSDGTEDGVMNFRVMKEGTSREHIRMSGSGGVVINEASLDIDFRVESDGNANMLFVDGGNDHVNIGTATDLGGVLNVSGNGVFQNADQTDTLSLVNTDADANVGPRLKFARNSGSPADGDVTGDIRFEAKDDGGNDFTQVTIVSTLEDATNGTEDAQLAFDVMLAGTLRERMSFGPGGTIFNDDSQDLDFRVESNDATHMLFVDGENNRVGINTSSPTVELEVVDTGGSSLLRVTGDASGAVTAQLAGSSSGYGAVGTTTNHDFVFQANNAEKMRLDSDGNVLVGGTSSSFPLNERATKIFGSNMGISHNTSNSDGDSYIRFGYNTSTIGSITQNGTTAVAYNTSSDYRLKENVNYDFDATSRLKQLKPSRFNFIADADTTVDGFLAHEVSSIVPEAISGDKDATETKTNVVVHADGHVIDEGITETKWTAGKVADEEGNTKYPSDSTWAASKVVPVYQGIDQSKLVPLLVKTIQELEARIVALES